MEKIFLLLVVYQLKHFIADYPLQTPYMLGKFKDGWDFIPPLALHAGVHAVFTFGIVFGATHTFRLSIMLAFFDFAVHFGMDRLKAGKKYLGRFMPLSKADFSTATDKERQCNKFFWWSLGFDQMVHHLTHYAIIACVVFAT